jgi:hypothetical protein
MNRTITCAVATVLLTFGSWAALADDDDHDRRGHGRGHDDERSERVVLEAETMVGVDIPYTGTVNPIREIRGGGAPWVLDKGEVELRADGSLKIKVEGLIVPRAGRNPAAFFRAIVSCLSKDVAGNAIIVNVATTNGAEVMIGDSDNGDARIRERLDLPTPCVAPIVFVTSATGSWFAATGL